MKVRLTLALMLGTLALFAGAAAQAGQACTDGVDCYCDCVEGANRGDGFVNDACAAKNIHVDSSVLVCEDFEARALTENVDFGSPQGGPWYDDTGYAGARGANSWWTRKYGDSTPFCAWRQGEAANPRYGTRCNFNTCFTDEWSGGNPWDANAYACMDIMRNGEFDDEVPTNAEPTLPGSGSGVFDGQQVIAHRVPRGDGTGPSSPTNGGFHGTKMFGRFVPTIGITQALAYPADILASGVWQSPWKDNQFGPLNEHWHRGSTAAGWGEVGTKPDQLPYAPYLFSTSDSACNAALANADLLVGKAFCAPGVLFFGPGNDDVAYLQSRDFPFGTWGCSRAYISGANSSNVTIKLWHNDRLIFHLEHFNGSALHSFDNNGSPNGFDRFHWNQYANHNGFVGQATSRTTYRYEDNVHIREGEPVSCNQIGFTSLTPPAPPPPIDPPPPTGTLGKPGTPVYVP